MHGFQRVGSGSYADYTDAERLELVLDDIFERNGTKPIVRNLFVSSDIRGSYSSNAYFIGRVRCYGSDKVLHNPYTNEQISVFVRNHFTINTPPPPGATVVFTVKCGRLEKESELLEFAEQVGIVTPEQADDAATPLPELAIIEKIICRTQDEFEKTKLAQIRLGIASNYRLVEWLYDRSATIGKTISDSESLMARVDELYEEVRTLEDKKEALEKERLQKETALEQLRQDVDDQSDALGELEEKLQTEQTRLHQLMETHPHWADSSLRTPLKPYDKLTGDTVTNMKETLSYDYDDEKIRQFLMALSTQQIIALCGQPGTGKTTFVSQMAHALNAKLTVVPAQNNWTDASDLMGYYNPLNGGHYHGTPFLDALLDARDALDATQDGKPQLHIICIDEMNLSRIEYYFATFLSLLQLDPGSQEIQLLPWDLRMRLRRYLEESDDTPEPDSGQNPDGADQQRCTRESERLAELVRYRDFTIPSNVRFVGTLNMDETTQPLSPKVVDRCLFIEFERPSNTSGGAAQRRGQAEQKRNEEYYYPASLFDVATDTEAASSFESQYLELPTIPDKLRSLVNYRLEHYMRQMWPVYWQTSSSMENQQDADGLRHRFLDTIVCTKILPGITSKTQVEKYIGDYKRAKRRFDQGSARGEGLHPYDVQSWSFWE